METQLSMADAVLDMLGISPIFLVGAVIAGILLAVEFKKHSGLPKVKTAAVTLLFYYYLCILLTRVVGFPTLREFIRLHQLGEGLFHPRLNFTPLVDGFSLTFILNIFLFIPLGFLCPLLSSRFLRAANTIAAGFFLSLFIEISQLFTLYRATDIDDLLTNTVGTVIGYLCFRLLAALRIMKAESNSESGSAQISITNHSCLPVIVITVAVFCAFFS